MRVVTVYCTFPDHDPRLGGVTMRIDPDVPPWSERRPCSDGSCTRYTCPANRNEPRTRRAWERECAAREVADWERAARKVADTPRPTAPKAPARLMDRVGSQLLRPDAPKRDGMQTTERSDDGFCP